MKIFLMVTNIFEGPCDGQEPTYIVGICLQNIRKMLLEWELGVVVSELGSRLKGCGFESRLFQILHGNGVKAMPGSIPVKTPNPGSQKIEKYRKPNGAHQKNIFFKLLFMLFSVS